MSRSAFSASGKYSSYLVARRGHPGVFFACACKCKELVSVGEDECKEMSKRRLKRKRLFLSGLQVQPAPAKDSMGVLVIEAISSKWEKVRLNGDF